jgi:ABC-2 type transport system permease protein
LTGSFERILATPLSRSSLMVGRALKEWAPLVVQGLLIALVCIPFGFVFHPLHVLFGLLILGIFGIGLGALSYALALVSQSKEWIFWGVQQTLLFPLMILPASCCPSMPALTG